jgi:phasin family protein
MTIKKIENGPLPSKLTTSAVSDGRNDGNEPSTTPNHINCANRGVAQMDGSTGMTMDATKTVANLTKTIEQITSFGQGNVEAIMKSGQIWVAGSQAISKTMATTAQAHLDQTMSTWKALINVKSLREAMDMRASLTHAPFETAFAEAGKLTDASMKLVEETMAPITERITLAAEKFRHLAN